MSVRRRWCAVALAIIAAAQWGPDRPVAADHDVVPEPPILPCRGIGRELAADLPLRDDGARFTIDALVVMDRVPEHLDVDAVIQKVAASFARMGLGFSATFETRDFAGTDTAKLMEQLKASLVGTGAERYDVVLLETGVDITTTGGVGIAGYATCLGGVRLKHELQSLAIAEIGWGARTSANAAVDLQQQYDALISAHEVGHLFGSTHEDGNCVESAGQEDLTFGDEFLRPCTVMANTSPWYATLHFGTAETAIIRGYARHYAAP